jgi:GrpB-like predicted nucleotidyltransferase (UPF0157 family)
MKAALMPCRPYWQDDFARHRQIIEKTLSNLEPVVEQIGSTSPGDIAAKPIIDILIGLREDKVLDTVVQPLIEVGYTYIQNFNAGMPYRRFFAALVAPPAPPITRTIGDDDALVCGPDYNSVANIHFMTWGSYHWIRHIAFRNYPRTQPGGQKIPRCSQARDRGRRYLRSA